MVVTVASLKGGVGKTTTAVHMAAYVSGGEPVVLVDADSERSALSWAELGELPFRVEEGHRDSLARQVRALARTSVVIIDTPPNDREILHRASILGDHVLVPLKPTGVDVNRLRPTLELLRDVEATRGDLDVAILFTHWDGRKVLAREAIEALGRFPVLDTKIRDLTRYEQSFGAAPTYLLEYGAAWKELTNAEA